MEAFAGLQRIPYAVIFEKGCVHGEDLDEMSAAEILLRLVEISLFHQGVDQPIDLFLFAFKGGGDGGSRLLPCGAWGFGAVVDLLEVTQNSALTLGGDLLPCGDGEGLVGGILQRIADASLDTEDLYRLMALMHKIADDRAEMTVTGEKNISVDRILEGMLVDMVQHDEIGKVLFVVGGSVLCFDNSCCDLTDPRDLLAEKRVGKVAEEINVYKLVAFGKAFIPFADIGLNFEAA